MSNPKKEAPQCGHPAKELKVWRPNDGLFHWEDKTWKLLDQDDLPFPTLYLCPSCGITLEAGCEQLKRAVKRDLEALAQ